MPIYALVSYPYRSTALHRVEASVLPGLLNRKQLRRESDALKILLSARGVVAHSDPGFYGDPYVYDEGDHLLVGFELRDRTELPDLVTDIVQNLATVTGYQFELPPKVTVKQDDVSAAKDFVEREAHGLIDSVLTPLKALVAVTALLAVVLVLGRRR